MKRLLFKNGLLFFKDHLSILFNYYVTMKQLSKNVFITDLQVILGKDFLGFDMVFPGRRLNNLTKPNLTNILVSNTKC